MNTGSHAGATSPGVAAGGHNVLENSENPDRQRTPWGLKAAIVVFLMSVVVTPWVYVWIEVDMQKYLRPAHDKVTMQQQLKALGDYRQIRRLRTGGECYYLVDHSPRGLLIPSSGPAQYLFDEDGVLVDWVRDSGDAQFPRLQTLMNRKDLMVDVVKIEAALALQGAVEGG